MKTILVPTDFSPCAEIALNYAVMLAQKADAEIILVHSFNLLDSKLSDDKFLMNDHNGFIQTELYCKLNRLKFYHEHTTPVRITTKLYEGNDITDCILKAANDHHATLIVMGTLGAANLRNKIFGSNAADVINKSEIPVLTIPRNYACTEPKDILIAINDIYEDPETLAPVFNLAHLFNGKLCIALFTEEDDEVLDVIAHTRTTNLIEYKLKSAYKKAPIDVIKLSGRDFHETIMQFIREKQINLLSMITYRRGFWESIFSSSLTQKMSYHSTIPLLSLHSVYE
jgi:nucleotide-binding universal stress UspA family protein